MSIAHAVTQKGGSQNQYYLANAHGNPLDTVRIPIFSLPLLTTDMFHTDWLIHMEYIEKIGIFKCNVQMKNNERILTCKYHEPRDSTWKHRGAVHGPRE